MILQIIKLRSALEEAELLRIAHEREPEFRAIPGLLQKYYCKDPEPGRYRGVYVWDSAESLEAFRSSDLARSIPAAYQTLEPPSAERLEILFQLREATPFNVQHRP